MLLFEVKFILLLPYEVISLLISEVKAQMDFTVGVKVHQMIQQFDAKQKFLLVFDFFQLQLKPYRGLYVPPSYTSSR